MPAFNLRNLLIFKVHFHSTNYDHASPLNWALRIIYNAYNIDTFLYSLPYPSQTNTNAIISLVF